MASTTTSMLILGHGLQVWVCPTIDVRVIDISRGAIAVLRCAQSCTIKCAISFASLASCAVIRSSTPQQRMPILHSGAITLVRSGGHSFTLGERVVAVDPPLRVGEVVVCQRNLQVNARPVEAFATWRGDDKQNPYAGISVGPNCNTTPRPRSTTGDRRQPRMALTTRLTCSRSRASSIFCGLKAEVSFVDCASSSASDSMVLLLSMRAIKLLHMSKSAVCSIARGTSLPFACSP